MALLTLSLDGQTLAEFNMSRERYSIGRLADKISAVFVPSVLIIAVVTFLVWFNIGPAPAASFGLVATMTVLVIACPCAMGLATPAAIAVGLGRSARNGILFRNAKSLEFFRNIRQVVFDKTGTLTTGTPEGLAAFLNKDFELWDKLIKQQGIRVE